MTSPARVERDESPRAAWATALGTTPVLRHLDPAEIQRLINDGTVEAFADGAEVIGAGAPTSAVYFLVEGECDVHRADRTVRLTAPAMAGEIAALTGTLRTATVRAAGSARTVVVPAERFLEAIRTSAAAGQALTELVADRICAPDSIREVGRFAIEAIVGSGGSGRVLRARHPLLEIPIALKMLSHALALMPGAPRAFVREASLLAQLDHPGIVRVLDAFEALGTFFIVMPWIEGATLRELIDRGVKFTAEEIRRVAAEALDALMTVHAAGLVHRDIKPSNLFVRSSGRVVLIDFGIAVAAPGAAAPSPEPRAPRLGPRGSPARRRTRVRSRSSAAPSTAAATCTRWRARSTSWSSACRPSGRTSSARSTATSTAPRRSRSRRWSRWTTRFCSGCGGACHAPVPGVRTPLRRWRRSARFRTRTRPGASDRDRGRRDRGASTSSRRGRDLRCPRRRRS